MKTILTLATLLSVSFITFGQAGMLDPSFGNGGESLTLTNNKSGGCINDIEQQPDGKIVAAGEEYFSTQIHNPLVIRYNTNGTLDSSFGINGFGDVSIHSSRRYDAGMVVKVLSDGKILALINAENSKTNDPDIYIIRLNANGTKDSSFGKNGVAIKDKGINYAYAMQVQADGKILLGARINSIACIFRCNADGSTDTTFGDKGLILLRSFKYSYITAIAFTSNQQIIVGGSGRKTIQSDDVAFVSRYSMSGELDTTFAVKGYLSKQTQDYSQSLSSLSILPDNSLLVCYFLFHNTRYYPVSVLSKYHADGSLDSGFANRGKITSGVPKDFSSYRALDMAVQQDGKIVLAGQYLNKKGKYAISVTRLLDTGEKDLSFGNNGNTTTYHYYNKPTSILIQQDGRIVVGGCIQKKYGAKWQLSLSRYLPGNNTATSRQTPITIDKKVLLYPNPVKDILHIHGLDGKTVSIINMQGVVIKRLIVNADTYNLNVSAFSKGMYFLKIDGYETNSTYKFIKE